MFYIITTVFRKEVGKSVKNLNINWLTYFCEIYEVLFTYCISYTYLVRFINV